MAQLKTTFAGLTLKNPIVISSSGLTNSPEKIKKLEEAGAGAVVLKSVFEEQINMQAGTMHGYGAPEADDYLNAYVRSHALNGHISLIEETKKTCTIPVIASINCYSDNEWVDFAKLMENAGADALEINILSLQTEKEYIPGSFEQRHINILRHVKKEVKIPVIMKLGSNLTNPIALIDQLYANGRRGCRSVVQPFLSDRHRHRKPDVLQCPCAERRKRTRRPLALDRYRIGICPPIGLCHIWRNTQRQRTYQSDFSRSLRYRNLFSHLSKRS